MRTITRRGEVLHPLHRTPTGPNASPPPEPLEPTNPAPPQRPLVPTTGVTSPVARMCRTEVDSRSSSPTSRPCFPEVVPS